MIGNRKTARAHVFDFSRINVMARGGRFIYRPLEDLI
jgi:hypothetical protein